MFTPEAYADSWNYVGLFREYLNPDFAPGAYKLARLPWILAGFLTHQLFPPVPAAYVLHGSFLILTSLALFAGLYALSGRVSLAGVAATMLGFYTHAHGSGGWDYHNTAAGAFYLLAFLLLALPGTTSGRRVHCLAAGVATALAVHSNITFVNFLPALVFVHLQTIRVRAGRLPPVRALLARVAWGTLGAVLVTAVLGFINVLAGREFFFFSVLAKITAQYVADPRFVAGWKREAGWFLAATYLALPAAVFFVGALSLVVNRRSVNDRTNGIAWALILQFLVMSLVWVGWETAGQLALSWSYFAYVLIPSCFIAIGGLFAFGWPAWCERHWVVSILLTAVAAALFLSGAADSLLRALLSTVGTRLVATVCASFVVALGSFVLRPAIVPLLVVLGVFAAGNSLMATNPIDYTAQDTCKLQQDIYAAVVEGASDLGALDKTHSRVRTWFDEGEQLHPTNNCRVNLGWMSSAMTQMAFLPYLASPWPTMPAVDAVPDSAIRTIVATDGILVIVTARQRNIDAWDRRLKAMDLEHREVANRLVRLRDSDFSIHAWQIPQKPPVVEFDAPIIAITDQTPATVNVYGMPKGRLVKEAARVVFKGTDARDHVAYPFAMFPARATETWLKVTVDFPPSTSNSVTCWIGIQNPKLTNIALLPCRAETSYLKLPAQTNGLRVFLTDTRYRNLVVPARLELALAR
jgi:hypothetical protein